MLATVPSSVTRSARESIRASAVIHSVSRWAGWSSEGLAAVVRNIEWPNPMDPWIVESPSRAYRRGPDRPGIRLSPPVFYIHLSPVFAKQPYDAAQVGTSGMASWRPKVRYYRMT